MSARSAAARKKATTTHKKAPPPPASSRSRPRAFVPAEYEYSYPYGQNVQYAQPQHQYAPAPQMLSPPLPPPPPESVIGTSSSGSQSAPSEFDDPSASIERSGFRTMLDKRSDDVRKGLAKTFTFRRKDSREEEIPAPVTPFQRPESAATARPNFVGDGYGYERPPSSTQPRHMQYYPPQQLQQVPYSPPYQQHQAPTSPIERWEVSSLGPPPATELPAVPQSSGPPIKRWVGGGRPPARWNKLRKDPELWNPNGDVLVYLQARGNDQPASFRLSSHVIEASENRWLVAELRNGVIEDREDPTIPTPPAVAPGYNSHLGHPTPPVSESDQLEGEISYEMRFPPPKPLSRQDKIQHQITTRNVFAMLCHASLVGISLHQALVDLHARLELYRSPGEPDTAGQIITYLSSRAIDDMRNDVESAVGILAWAERPGVRWSEGWREAFLHCAGMYRDGRGSNGCGGLDRCADWKYVTPQTRALLERSWLEMRLKVQTAEERLTDFTLPDIWAAGTASEFRTAPPVGSAKATAERFQKMLIAHYTRVYGSWPPARPAPTTEDEEAWLTRSVARDLQRDFGALYDYLVDREVVWDVSEARAGRKWMMVSTGWNKGFDADVPGMPMTDIIIEFDNRMRIPHIPHPHPLLPSSIPPQTPGPTPGGMFRTASSTSVQQKQQAGRERRVALAYTESTNLDALDTSAPSPSDLVDAFSRFEKSDAVAEVDPAMARRGRWVLLYGILQALAPVSVDAPRMKYCEGVSYHLSARLKRPTWSKDRGANNASALFGEVRHDMSHCWTTPATWASSDLEGQTDEDELAVDETRDGFRPPPRGLPELSEGSSVRTNSTTRRYYPPQPNQRRPDEGTPDLPSPSSPGGVPKSRFYTQSAPLAKTDSSESTFLNIDDVTFPTPGGYRTPPGQALPLRPQRRGEAGAPEIRDFDDDA